MQSIYRFRQADVGLFLHAREKGVGNIQLEFVQLQVNFRSCEGMIDWFNHAFSQCFPKRNDMTRGAICYTSSRSGSTSQAGDPGQKSEDMPVTVYPFVAKNREEGFEVEAERICDLINNLREQGDISSIAVLVRNRSHLLKIIPHLRHAGIAFHAVEIERLGKEPVVRDLVALTQALMQPAHRVAWFSVLRAPFVGLTLADLLVLSDLAQENETIFALIKDALQEERLSNSARCRLQRCLPIFSAARDERGRMLLSELVERVWCQLGGAAVLQTDIEMESAESFFRRLTVIERSPFDVMDLPELLEDLFASGSHAFSDEVLQLMTIHKAKGLEFDAVILPGLGHKSRGESSRLLYWSEYVSEWGHDFLLSSIRNAASRYDSALTGFIKDIEHSRLENEAVRLLYVAATRARKRLYLFGQVPEKDGEISQPNTGSLLSYLWPVVADRFHEVWQTSLGKDIASPEIETGGQDEPLRRFRLSLDWTSCPSPIPLLQRSGVELRDIEFEWAGEEVRHIGTVIHRIFQYIGENCAGELLTQERRRMRKVAKIWLEAAGVPDHRMLWALDMVDQALQNLMTDPRGQWIFNAEHEHVSSEMALTGVDRTGVPRRVVVDRTFVDREGVRWVIDFKTGRHVGTDVDIFLDQEQERYRAQLEGYASIFRRMEDRPIRLGLYFPLLPGWRQWDYLPSRS